MEFHIPSRVALAKTDEQARGELIRKNERRILAIASTVTRRFVSRSDDAWSVALIAFSKAIDTYEPDKGSFNAYSERVIRNSLIDELRREARRAEVTVAPEVFETDRTEGLTPLEEAVRYQVVKHSMATDGGLREEIESAGRDFEVYGFRFMELTSCCPKQEKTRRECGRAAGWLISHPELLERALESGRLPLRELAYGSGVGRKTLERYRRYILAVLVILTGDYPLLRDNLGVVGKEAALCAR